MKYYFVNFLLMNNNRIIEDSTIALHIPMDAYDAPGAFKKLICKQRLHIDANAIVIKTYKQISEDIYLLVHPFVKQNALPMQEETTVAGLSYKFQSSTYSG